MYNIEEKTLALDPGDLILVYSDGIIEAENNKEEFFGEERLIGILKRSGDIISENLIDGIYSEIKLFSK